MALTKDNIIGFLKSLYAREKHPSKGLFLVEYASLVYGIITALIFVVMGSKLVNPYYMIEVRLMLIGVTALLMWLYSVYPCRLTAFARVLFQFLLLISWYSETYEFNRVFDNLDYLFAGWEQQLFGCQPAIEFSKHLPGKFWSELFNLGYWSYFPMIALLVLYTFFVWPKHFLRVCFVLLSSFFLYYLIFIFVPVAGPQFYYLAIGYPHKDIYEIAREGFPALGDYFNHNTALLPAPGDPDGFFFQRVAEAQAAGERPTAAFPSSHVGCSTIMLILAWQTDKRLFSFLIPFYGVLVCATVYIQAHYLIDVIAGFVSAWLIFYLSNSVFLLVEEKVLPWKHNSSS